MPIYVPTVMYALRLFYKNYFNFSMMLQWLLWISVSVQSNSVQFLRYGG